MAQYKIPQDVEAEDKLIGPFSFRQFIYLGVAALGIAAGVGLWQIFPGLIIIPLPIVVPFLALALPLRKDQPMETYLTAVIRFFLKPRQRLWQPEGSISLVTVVAPRSVEAQLTKSIGGADAAAQLGYLAQVVDTQGWATRGVVSPTVSMNDTAYAEAQQAEDVLDENANVARTFESMIDKSDNDRRQTVMQKFQKAAREKHAVPQTPPPVAQPADAPPQDDAPHHSFTTGYTPPSDDDGLSVDYNPYPTSMHQHVISPVMHRAQPQNPAYTPAPSRDDRPQDMEQVTISQNTSSPEQVSPDIIRLATNNDLSISAIANEAHRIESKDNEEVIVNLH